MAKHLLTDKKVRNAKPEAKPYRLFDGDGLALLVSPTGARSWQLRYRFNGKEQTATLGKLERICLADARAAAETARKRISQGEHLTEVKRTAKMQRRVEATNTFRPYADAWINREAKRANWTEGYKEEVAASLRNHLSALDNLQITKITPPIAAAPLRLMEDKAPHMVEKVRRRLRAIFDDAVEQGLIQGNPLPAVRRHAKLEKKHYPAVTDLAGLGAILRAARAADPCKGVQRAHLLTAFTSLRISEIVGAMWSEFDLDGVQVQKGDGHVMTHDPSAGNWTVPRSRMKRKKKGLGPHEVPLPLALIAELREWRKADGPSAIYVCPTPGNPSKSITPEGVESFYRKTLGLVGKHSPHSWRSSWSTVCREAGKDGDAVESQMDHIVGTKVASAYDRAKRLEIRRELVQWYECQLIAARDAT